jgi:hypothetical protein
LLSGTASPHATLSKGMPDRGARELAVRTRARWQSMRDRFVVRALLSQLFSSLGTQAHGSLLPHDRLNTACRPAPENLKQLERRLIEQGVWAQVARRAGCMESVVLAAWCSRLSCVYGCRAARIAGSVLAPAQGDPGIPTALYCMAPPADAIGIATCNTPAAAVISEGSSPAADRLGRWPRPSHQNSQRIRAKQAQCCTRGSSPRERPALRRWSGLAARQAASRDPAGCDKH